MTRLTTAPAIATGAAGTMGSAGLEQQVRQRIELLSYLPTTAAVAMKFIELGKDPDADPADYAKVIGADASLSSKLLSLANSPWFGIRNKVTTVRMAVNLLGLGTVRTLAISYCMAGLHNELKLKPDESRLFWQGAVCKAVAARRLAGLKDPKAAEEAFVAGMFQDFALPIMYAVARQSYLAILTDARLDLPSKLKAERELFHLDHCEVGRILAQKLELPELFIDAVAFHHDRGRLGEFLGNEALSLAVCGASLFPMLLDNWNRADADAFCRLAEEVWSMEPGDLAGFMEALQKDYNDLYRYFEDGGTEEDRLAQMMIEAAREEADNNTHLVRTVHQLMQEAASVGMEVSQLVKSHRSLEDKAKRDPLTGVLNREGLNGFAAEILAKAARYGVGYALAFFDLDNFKQINDTCGHDRGDKALRDFASVLVGATRQQDCVARLGGDEFLLFVYDCRLQDAEQIVRRILGQVAGLRAGQGDGALAVSCSAGLLYVQPAGQVRALEPLVNLADKLMYKAKMAGGNRVEFRAV